MLASLKLAIVLACMASGFLPLAGNSAYATHENILVDGIIGPDGCKIIDGQIVTDTIDYVEPDRSVKLCNYNDLYHFKTMTYYLCGQAITYWTAPDTGYTYAFGSICSGPRFYNEISCNDGKAQVRTTEKLFYVLLDGNNSSCSRFDFNKEEKKLTMVVYADGQENRMNVTIPSELLGGKFSLMIDRGSTEDFLVDSKQGYSTISFSKFCLNECGYQVEIIGTDVTDSELLGYSYPSGASSSPKPLITNAMGERIEQPQVGQQVVMFGNYQNLSQRTQSYIMMFMFLDETGVTQHIAWQTGVAEPNSFIVAGVSWVPETKGEYLIRTFVISDLENPAILSSVFAYDLVVN